MRNIATNKGEQCQDTDARFLELGKNFLAALIWLFLGYAVISSDLADLSEKVVCYNRIYFLVDKV